MQTIYHDEDCATSFGRSLKLMRQSMTDSDFVAAVFGIREAVTSLFDDRYPGTCHRYVAMLDAAAIDAECHLRLVHDDEEG